MKTEVTVWDYATLKSDALKRRGRVRTAENYCKTMRCLHRYCPDDTLSFDRITEEFVESFNAFLKEQGIQDSTVSFYNRNLRSVYNQAAKEGLVKNTHPFDTVYTDVIVKLAPVSLLKTATGEAVPLDTITKEELLHQYLTLQGKYNNLVNKLSAIVGV